MSLTVIVVLIIFPVILQHVINFRMETNSKSKWNRTLNEKQQRLQRVQCYCPTAFTGQNISAINMTKNTL